MKLKLTKDMAKVRAEAKLQIQHLIDSAVQFTNQDLAYLRKAQNAQAFLDGVAVTPVQLKDEADLRGVSVGQLARSIASKAQKSDQKREAVETLRIKHGLALKNASTEQEAMAIVASFAKELQTLKTQ